jgi:hypothetical protein
MIDFLDIIQLPVWNKNRTMDIVLKVNDCKPSYT